MLNFEYVSARGDTLQLVKNPYFILSNIDGQTIANTSLSSAEVGGVDGDTMNNIQATARTIILELIIRPDADVEEAKREILKIVKLKQRGDLIWTQQNRTVVINGVVEAVELPRWTDSVTMQITLHCEQPFWEDIDDVVQQISEAINLHCFTASPVDMLYFPVEGVPLGAYDTLRTKTFHNAGDVAVGLEITILAHDTVTNPIIYDQNGNYFGIGTAQNPFVMHTGDNVVITTHRGRKSVKHNGAVILDKIKPNSTWLQLDAGDNVYSINSDEDSITNMSFSLIYKQRYI